MTEREKDRVRELRDDLEFHRDFCTVLGEEIFSPGADEIAAAAELDEIETRDRHENERRNQYSPMG